MSEENENSSEVEARQFGWVPKEEFNGEEGKWRDADEFLRRGREINGFLRKDLDKIKSQLSAKEIEILEMKSTLNEFKEFHKKTEERAYKRALEELKQEKKQAIAEGDGDRVVAIDEQIDAIKEEQQKPTPQPTNTQDAIVFNQWMAENEIFAKDKTVMAIANGLADVVKQENPSLVGRAFLDEVAKRVREELPHKFENSNSTRPSAVSSSSDSGAGRTGGKKKSYADLPSDAKTACDKFVKQGLMTQAEYIKDYFQGE